MSLYAIDVINVAYKRTVNSLFEPFNMNKWIYFCIIWLLLVPGSISYYQSPKSVANFFWSLSYGIRDLGHPYEPTSDIIIIPCKIFSSIRNVFSSESYSTDLISNSVLAALLALLFIAIVLLFISSTMEFMFVNSLVHNYRDSFMHFSSFLGKGFQLFNIRIVIHFVSAIILILLLLNQYGLIPDTYLFLSVPNQTLILLVAFLLLLSSEVLGFFIGLSIPITLYSNVSVISALSNVFRKGRHDFKQLFVYLLVRVVLNLLLGVIALIALVPLLFIPGISIVLMEEILEAIVQPSKNWFIIASYRLLELTIFILSVCLVFLPVNIFLKYHMISFLEKWYPEARIPFNQEEF